MAMILDIPAEDIRAGLERVESVPGRIEMLPTGTPYKVILDYSHSPDALENILKTVREFTRGPGYCAVWLRRRPGPWQAPHHG